MDSPQLMTATGSIASFSTGISAPLKSCKVEFMPVQEGIGDPSPSNVRPITGWNGLTVHHVSDPLYRVIIKNFQSETINGVTTELLEDGTLCFHGTPTGAFALNYEIEPMIIDSTTNRLLLNAHNLSAQVAYVQFRNASGGIMTSSCSYVDVVDDYVSSYTISSGDSYVANAIRYVPGNGYTEASIRPMIMKSTTLKNKIITFPENAGTIYGGYIDLITGELVQTHGHFVAEPDADGTDWYYSETSYGYYCAYDLSYLNEFRPPMVYKPAIFNYLSSPMATRPWTGAVGSTTSRQLRIILPFDVGGLDYLRANPLEVVYELETPVRYQLTPQQIKTLKGANNIWSNANGNISVEYWKH